MVIPLTDRKVHLIELLISRIGGCDRSKFQESISDFFVRETRERKKLLCKLVILLEMFKERSPVILNLAEDIGWGTVGSTAFIDAVDEVCINGWECRIRAFRIRSRRFIPSRMDIRT